MKTIEFNNDATAWTGRVDNDLMFLETQADYIKEMFVHRGYMYLNQIYEYFGIKWNPGFVSPCYLLKSGPLTFRFEPVRDVAILIHIR
jgi:hypothetical protein